MSLPQMPTYVPSATTPAKLTVAVERAATDMIRRLKECISVYEQDEQQRNLLELPQHCDFRDTQLRQLVRHDVLKCG